MNISLRCQNQFWPQETLSSAAYTCWVQKLDTRPCQIRPQHSHGPHWTGLDDWPFRRCSTPLPDICLTCETNSRCSVLLLGSAHHHLHSAVPIHTRSHAVTCGLNHKVSTPSPASPTLLFAAPKYHSLTLPARHKFLSHGSNLQYNGQLQWTSHSVGLPG